MGGCAADARSPRLTRLTAHSSFTLSPASAASQHSSGSVPKSGMAAAAAAAASSQAPGAAAPAAAAAGPWVPPVLALGPGGPPSAPWPLTPLLQESESLVLQAALSRRQGRMGGVAGTCVGLAPRSASEAREGGEEPPWSPPPVSPALGLW
jgi:hypothetical protein